MPSNGGEVFHAVLVGIHVLVVDDVMDNREIERLLLEWHGATVTEADSVASALAAIERAEPDVILTDIHMPGEDGYALARAVRNRAAAGGRTIPVVALTADVTARASQATSAAGFDAVLVKPVEPHTLVSVIAAILRRY